MFRWTSLCGWYQASTSILEGSGFEVVPVVCFTPNTKEFSVLEGATGAFFGI